MNDCSGVPQGGEQHRGKKEIQHEVKKEKPELVRRTRSYLAGLVLHETHSNFHRSGGLFSPFHRTKGNSKGDEKGRSNDAVSSPLQYLYHDRSPRRDASQRMRRLALRSPEARPYRPPPFFLPFTIFGSKSRLPWLPSSTGGCCFRHEF